MFIPHYRWVPVVGDRQWVSCIDEKDMKNMNIPRLQDIQASGDDIRWCRYRPWLRWACSIPSSSETLVTRAVCDGFILEHTSLPLATCIPD